MHRLFLLRLLLSGFLTLGTFSLLAQDYFTWDNATLYFLLTDRFYDGNPTNNNSYGRSSDPIGGFQGGDLQGLTQKISDGYFDELGVDAIWFTAPYEQIHGAVPGYWNGYPNDSHYAYHGYYALDFTEVDANMGTVADMQAFVDTAHAHGIRVVMDIVLNHVGYETVADANEFGFGPLGDPWQVPNNGLDPNGADWCNWWTDSNGNPWIRKGDTATDYCATACGGNDLELCLAGLPDIRTELTTAVGLPKILQTKWDATKESQELNELNDFFNTTGLTATPANHIIKWLTDWVRDYGIDGFRIDTYKHTEREIWGELKTQAQIAFDDWKTTNPGKVLDNNDFWMVGEWYGHGPNKNVEAATLGKTDALINFNFQGQAGNPANLESIYAAYANIAADPDWNFLNYVSSHDTDLFDRNDLYDAGTALLLAPGAAQIFYGDETQRQPLNTGTDQDTRSMMNWNSINTALQNHWKKLGTFRKKHPAVGGGTHQQLSASPYTFVREYQNAADGICDKIVAAVGLAAGSHTLDVSGAFANDTEVRNYYTGAIATVTNGEVTFTVGSEGVILLEYVEAPVCISVEITPDICYSEDPVLVSIRATDGQNPGITPDIYYSFDALARPDDLSDWMVYTQPFTLSESATVYAFAKNANGDESEIESQQYTIDANPTMTLRWNAQVAGCTTPYLYAWEMNGAANAELAPWPGVPMTDSDGDGWYEYTLNAAFSNVIFSCNGGGQTADLFACGDACYDVGWVDCPTVAPTVTIAPGSDNFPEGTVEVTLSAEPGTCNIYYTTDGSTPTTNSNLYTAPLTLNGDENTPVTLQAIAECNGQLTPVKTATYTFETVAAMTLRWNPEGSCATPYLYAWEMDGVTNAELAPWPGVLMTDDNSDGWYEYTINASSTNVIFNCGGFPDQTADLSATGDACFQGNVFAGEWVTCPAFCENELTLNGSIAAGTYQAGQSITVKGQIEPTTTVTLEAGATITLGINFHAKANSMFTARIAENVCTAFAESPAPQQLSTNPDTFTETAELYITPNPFANEAQIRYFLPKGGTTDIRLLDMNGRLVKKLVSGQLTEGWHDIRLTATDLPKGLYFIHFQTTEERLTRKVVIVD